MLAVDLFEFLGGFLEVLLLVQKEDALVIELVGRLIGRCFLLGEQAEIAACAEERQRQHQKEPARERAHA